jgi:replication-associated recombination protein RarA
MQLKTIKGYDFFEASSAFQKSVRRGDEETALYFAVEFFNSNYDNYLWKRMRIIASEDVGLAEPMMCVIIQSLFQSYTDLAKEKKEEEKS